MNILLFAQTSTTISRTAFVVNSLREHPLFNQ